MKLLIHLLLGVSFCSLCQAQSTQSFELNGMQFRYEALNEVSNPNALLVLFDGGAGIASRIAPETNIPNSAAQHSIMTIGIDQSEFYLTDSIYTRIKTIVQHVMQENEIPENLFMGGFSLGGFTTLRFTEMAVEKGDSDVIPNAVFVVDGPLDHLDFVDYCLRELDRECPNPQANQLGKAEANWILGYYDEHFGSAEYDREVYIHHSAFTARESDGGNAKYLKNIPVHMIHEIDPMWLIQERCRDLTDVNAVIGSKLVNFLYQEGNTEATITLTTDKGYRADSRRHPHSWSIAEPDPTLNWLSKYLKK